MASCVRLSFFLSTLGYFSAKNWQNQITFVRYHKNKKGDVFLRHNIVQEVKEILFTLPTNRECCIVTFVQLISLYYYYYYYYY